MDDSSPYRRTPTGSQLVFTPQLAVGLDEIDVHHQHMVELFNRAITPGTGAVADLLEDIERYVGFHFTSEILLMRTYGYPRVERHEKEHQGIWNLFIEKSDDCLRDPSRIVELGRFFNQWLISHSASSDLDVAHHIRARRQRQSPSITPS